MSDAVWPVFEDGFKHGLCDEGAPVLRAYKDLDAIATAAGRMPLSVFDKHSNVPDDVIAQLAEEAQDIPDLSCFPVVWHDPTDAVATLDVILSVLASQDPVRPGRENPEYLASCLDAIRQALQQAVTRKTRFNFTIA